jgi:translocation and assembly module TamB
MRNTDKPSPALHSGHRLRRWLGTSALLAVACGGLVWGAHGWSGSEGSLASSLRLASHLMPAGQSLSTDQVSGSLRHGGLVGQWHWQQAALQVRGQGTRITLDWSQLWLGQLPLTGVDMDSLRIDDQNPSSPATPLTQLQWPLKVDLPWRIGRLEWAGPPALEALALNGRYAFNGTEHLLQLQPFEVAQGRYSLTVQLQAAAPMALQAQLHGQVLGTRTAGSKPLDLVAQASLQGTLAGAEAALTLNAELQATSSPSGMPLKVQAHIAPWQDQPLTQADAQVQQLNLAALWPGAPQTRLSGQASITPQGPSWQIQAQLKNQSPGPWDRHALPMSQLSAQLQRQANGLWQVQQLQAQIAQGQVKGEGQQTAAGWTGQVHITGIQPDQLHTALAGSALNGQIKAESVNAHTVAVQADLNAEPSAKAQAGLRWERLHLKGLWQAALWDIQSLDVQAADARLQGQLRYQPAQQTAQAQLQWQSPGMHAQAQGLLGPKQGQGEVTLDVSDAALGMAWLKRWPGWTERLQGWQASGPAHSRVQWQGGYQQADTKLQWQTVLPRLTAQANSTEPLHLQKGQLKVQGRLAALQANIEAQVLRGTQTWRLQSQAHAGSSTESLGQWQGHLDSASLQLSTPEQASAWTAQLSSAVPWQWSSGPMAQQLRWQAGRISVQGSTPGQAWLQWDAGQWQSSTGPQGAALSTMAWSANIDALPMRWLPTGFGPEVQSDLLLKGQIKWEQTPALKVRAKLERSSGDLRFDADNSASPRIRAGLREASVALSIDDAQAAVQLIWDTEQMGQLQAQGQTRLSHDAQGWHWPDDAPVSGNLTAQLPRVGAWSLLAPPGWRVQGTLETQLSLSGTRQNPQWQGQVRADNLAVRSAVQGIEFSQGQLRARVQGQQVHLDQLSLRGAGAQGGELQTQGQLTWLPPANGATSASPLGQVDMVLNLQAKALRVSNRADRRLAISGQVKAQMQKGQLQLRGQVQADQGLFILPEDSTPTLGSDVFITDKRRPPTPPNATAATTSASFMGTPDVQVTLDLGPDFQVQGQGLATRLAGQVVLTSNAATKGIPRLSGEVSTEGGRYKAYGQQLNIETGLLRFNGPYDNPLLDILAIRPNLSQRVGVQISGSVNTPKVRLYADPDMPDADKLAWLVLGRSGANGGAESAVLQQAALALFSSNGKTLGSEMAGALGLDEISLANGSRSDIGSSATATGAAVTLGKRLSKDFYLVYETSLKGTFGSFYVFYDLSRRLTLRAQTGQDNALDLIYTVRKD